jgi:sulfur-oxidizing protein SoxZ
MARKIKIRARAKDATATVKFLMQHPMETGLRKDKKTGKKIPAHYISDVTVSLNGTNVMTAYLGPGVSTDPYLSTEVKGASKGDTITVAWVDNMGEQASAEAKVK